MRRVTRGSIITVLIIIFGIRIEGSIIRRALWLRIIWLWKTLRLHSIRDTVLKGNEKAYRCIANDEKEHDLSRYHLIHTEDIPIKCALLIIQNRN